MDLSDKFILLLPSTTSLPLTALPPDASAGPNDQPPSGAFSTHITLYATHRMHSEDLLDAFKRSMSAQPSGLALTIDFAKLFELHDRITASLVRAAQEHLVAYDGLSETDKRMMELMLEELEGTTMEGIRWRDAEKRRANEEGVSHELGTGLR